MARPPPNTDATLVRGAIRFAGRRFPPHAVLPIVAFLLGRQSASYGPGGCARRTGEGDHRGRQPHHRTTRPSSGPRGGHRQPRRREPPAGRRKTASSSKGGGGFQNRPLMIFPLLKELGSGWKNMEITPLLRGKEAFGTRSLVVDVGLDDGDDSSWRSRTDSRWSASSRILHPSPPLR